MAQTLTRDGGQTPTCDPEHIGAGVAITLNFAGIGEQTVHLTVAQISELAQRALDAGLLKPEKKTRPRNAAAIAMGEGIDRTMMIPLRVTTLDGELVELKLQADEIAELLETLGKGELGEDFTPEELQAIVQAAVDDLTFDLDKFDKTRQEKIPAPATMSCDDSEEALTQLADDVLAGRVPEPTELELEQERINRVYANPLPQRQFSYDPDRWVRSNQEAEDRRLERMAEVIADGGHIESFEEQMVSKLIAENLR